MLTAAALASTLTSFTCLLRRGFVLRVECFAVWSCKVSELLRFGVWGVRFGAVVGLGSRLG